MLRTNGPTLSAVVLTVDDDEDARLQSWMLATTHPSVVVRVPDENRGRPTTGTSRM